MATTARHGNNDTPTREEIEELQNAESSRQQEYIQRTENAYKSDPLRKNAAGQYVNIPYTGYFHY